MGQVVVQIGACGVNFPDVLMIQNKYQFKPPLPFSPGSDVAGIVKEVGDGVTAVRVGDRVAAMCGFGGFAEEVAFPAVQCLALPDALDFVHGAAVLMTYGTSYYALQDRAQLRSGETLLVLGAGGGVGLAAVELGKVMGARVIAAASSDEKLAVCREYGASEGINYSREDLKARLKELTGGQGVDVVYDPVGGDLAEAALRGTGWNGRYLVIGFTAGIPRIPLNLVLLKGCQIVGVFWGAHTMREPERNRKAMLQLLDWCATGKLKPLVSETFPLERAADALKRIEERKVKGKVVLVP
jgi:NADPH2:quinone reductase